MSPSKDDPTSVSSSTKIAMKGFSLTSKPSTKPKPNPPSSLGKRSRTTFAHHEDSDSENEGANGRLTKHEAVTGFGEGGAIEGEAKKKTVGPLVIPKLANRDWRGEARVMRGKNLLPPEVQAARAAAAKESADRAMGVVKQESVDVVNSNDGEITWGLSVRKRETHDAQEEKEHSLHNGDTEKLDAPIKKEEKEEEEVKPKSMDQEALEALMGTRKEKKGPDLVIPVAIASEDYAGPVSEQDAYKRALASAPDVSTLEDYERVPVEEFGAALLRGMGWKGEVKGRAKEVKRRQNLLGLGAKELKDAEELGAWVQKSDVKRLNEKGRGSGHGSGDRRPKVNEYRREKERKDQRREERGGGSYRRERERERDSGRDSDRDRERYRERDDYRRR